MSRCAALLSLVVAAPIASAGTEHIDVLLMINPEGELVTGLVEVDAQQTIASEQRIYAGAFDIIPLGGGFEASTTDNPGYNALLSGNPTIPAGYSTLPPSTPVSFDADAIEVGETASNLWFWDGTGEPDFAPATVTLNVSKAPSVLFSADLDGSANDVPGFVIDTSNSGGGLHRHVDYTINDSQNAPRGFYVWAFTLSTDTTAAKPMLFVHALGSFDQTASDAAKQWVEDTILNEQPLCIADINGTGSVDIVDFSLFSAAFNTSTGDPTFDPRADLNDTGTVDIVDFTLFSTQFGFGPAECGG